MTCGCRSGWGAVVVKAVGGAMVVKAVGGAVVVEAVGGQRPAVTKWFVTKRFVCQWRPTQAVGAG